MAFGRSIKNLQLRGSSLPSRKTSHVFLSNKNSSSSVGQERLKELREHVPSSPTGTKKGRGKKSNHQFVI